MPVERVVLLGRDNSATALLFHALARHFDTRVVLEEPPTTMALLRSRIHRLGVMKVLGQILFQVIVQHAAHAFDLWIGGGSCPVGIGDPRQCRGDQRVGCERHGKIRHLAAAFHAAGQPPDLLQLMR